MLNEEPSVIAPKTDMEPLFLTSLKTERLEESLPNSLREMEEPSWTNCIVESPEPSLIVLLILNDEPM
jgi:hypothetical protein